MCVCVWEREGGESNYPELMYPRLNGITCQINADYTCKSMWYHSVNSIWGVLLYHNCFSSLGTTTRAPRHGDELTFECDVNSMTDNSNHFNTGQKNPGNHTTIWLLSLDGKGHNKLSLLVWIILQLSSRHSWKHNTWVDMQMFPFHSVILWCVLKLKMTLCELSLVSMLPSTVALGK